MKRLVLLLCSLALAGTLYGQYVRDTTITLSKAEMQWWRDAKFGLFLHYGLYSQPGRGEWVQWAEQIDPDEYAKLKDSFRCERFDAQQWVDVAKAAGCKYMVLTARHHDGFCLFDTKCGDFDAMNSPAKRDLVKEYADAARRSGMKVGIYYSPLDWRYPGFFLPNYFRRSAEEMKAQTYTQVRELMTHYGTVDILWYDGGEDNWLGFGGLQWDLAKGWVTRGFSNPYTGKFSWEPLKLNRMVRDLQPKVVISQRSGWLADFTTQEVQMQGRPAGDRPWELCTLFGGTAWGWTPDAATKVMTLDSCVHLLVRVVTQDGNLLVNVGPRADGTIEPLEVERLKEVGGFLARYGESIYGTRGGMYDAQWGGTTLSRDAIYVHVIAPPPGGVITIPPAPGRVAAARYLRDGSPAQFEQSGTGIRLTSIPDRWGEPDLIIKLTLH